MTSRRGLAGSRTRVHPFCRRSAPPGTPRSRETCGWGDSNSLSRAPGLQPGPTLLRRRIRVVLLLRAARTGFEPATLPLERRVTLPFVHRAVDLLVGMAGFEP